MKHATALIAAFLITIVVGLGMFVIGGNAALNKDGSAPLDSPQQANSQQANLAAPVADNQSRIDQLQGLVTQYQQREQQYQNELNTAQQQLDQANTTIGQYQQLFQALIQRGVIQVDQSGRVLIR
jgi:peptidoglycan hydrolase CwlO-like protein